MWLYQLYLQNSMISCQNLPLFLRIPWRPALSAEALKMLASLLQSPSTDDTTLAVACGEPREWRTSGEGKLGIFRDRYKYVSRNKDG